MNDFTVTPTNTNVAFIGHVSRITVTCETSQGVGTFTIHSTIDRHALINVYHQEEKKTQILIDIVLRQYVNDVREVRRNFVPRLHSSLPNEREWKHSRTDHVTARMVRPL